MPRPSASDAEACELGRIQCPAEWPAGFRSKTGEGGWRGDQLRHWRPGEESTTVTLQALERPSNHAAVTDSAGHFHFDSVEPGNLPSRSIDLTKGSGPATVLLATDVGEVEGSVKKANGDPAARVRVTLIAYGSHLGRTDLANFGFADDLGKFHLRSVAPGEYKVFAWEDAPAGAPQDPEFRKPFEKQAVAVKMAPNGHETVELTAISVKRSQRPN